MSTLNAGCMMLHPVQVVEAGLGHLPFTEKTVLTPTGRQYVGVDFAKKLCGVSIIRSGESMENALRACCKGIKIGKILVHRYDTSVDIVRLLVARTQLTFCVHQGVRQRRWRAHIREAAGGHCRALRDAHGPHPGNRKLSCDRNPGVLHCQECKFSTAVSL